MQLQVRLCKLKELNLYLDDSPKKLDAMVSIRETQWEMFFAYLPRATVSLKIEKPIRDEQFKNIMHKHYPLLSFSWNYKYYRETCQMDCCQCLERLTNLQFRTLGKCLTHTALQQPLLSWTNFFPEYIHLNLPLEQWDLHDKINFIKRKCRKIKSFIFNNVQLVHSNNYFDSPVKFGPV